MSADNATIGRRWFEQVWNQGNVDAADQLAAPDFVAHGHAPNDATIGIPQFKQFARAVLAAFPDIRVTVEDTISEGDRTVIRWHAHGTHQGPFMGVAPKGAAISVRGVSVMRFANGKIVEAWDNWDQLGMLIQIGAVPAASLVAA